ncbi:MAG TPA: hypothetical protein PLQ76_07200, partial [bacterium]|nr:hypothetical protein [bacterium]
MSLIHRLTNEGSGFQRRTLYLLARRLELPFLRVSYNLMRGKWRGIGARRSVRALYAAAVTRPIATHGDSARPIPFEPLADFIRSLDCSIAVGPCRCRSTHRS